MVLYSPYLSADLDCHINVEICASMKAIKYIHKYIYKEYDLCTVQVGQGENIAIDEIKEYIIGCYISPVEACWHIFEFPMHAESPTVYLLHVYFKDEQMVYFNAEDDPQEIADCAANKNTHLMG